LLLGGRKIRRMAKQKTSLYDPRESEPIDNDSPSSNVQRILVSAGMPPARKGNRVELIPHDATARNTAGFEALASLIEGAEKYIHMTTFILGRDDTGRAIVELLAKKAEEGVRVRLLLDALGCLRTRGRFVDPIRRAGGEVEVFMPVLPVRRKWSANLRNHRKILVVDGQKAMVGGMNIAEQYVGSTANPKRFLDTAAIVSGPAVTDLDAIFASDWDFATDEENDFPGQKAEAIPDGTLAQIAASGPDTPGDAIYDAIITAIMEAKQRIWITTPYFIPDEALMKALSLQTRLGRDVRIFVPRRSNHLLADLARGRFLRELIQHGAKVFAFERMVHAKLMLFDEQTTVIGSANIDSRSFYLNYEVQLVSYGRREAEAVAQWIQAAAADASRMESSEISTTRGWAEDLAALVAPLL